MGLLTSNIGRFRNDPRIFKIPPYLAFLCMIGGILWICLLPYDQYSRRTYVSENALLPGQVHTYFTGSEQNIFRAYRHEVSDILEARALKDDQGQETGQWVMATEAHRTSRLEEIFRNAGIKTARQSYKYTSAGKTYEGENVYGIVHGPRADGTESIVLVASIKNNKGELNVNGVTLILSLARYFSRWSLWSKDIILVITPDTATGPQAWVDAYHSMHDPAKVADLTLKSGHIQGVICIDYPFNHRFNSLSVVYDGVNGQLPNLDLINTAVAISSGQMGIGSHIQNQYDFVSQEHQGEYQARLRTLFRGMRNQALGHATGAHSVFMPYHIDAITLTAVGSGWEDEMAFGRTVESLVRSLNNLLEKLHQSFFFYLLLQNTRFVSIGTYLPSAMAVGAGFTILALFGWVRSGYDEIEAQTSTSDNRTAEPKPQAPATSETNETIAATLVKDAPSSEVISPWKSIDRNLATPLAYIAAIQLASLLPIYFLTHLSGKTLNTVFIQASIFMMGAPLVLDSTLIITTSQSGSSDVPDTTRKTQFFTILSSVSMLILGLDLTVLATLNFSLSMFLGILCSPLAFVGYHPPKATPSKLDDIRNVVSVAVIFIFSPPIIVISLAMVDTFFLQSSMSRPDDGWYATLQNYLENEAFAFNIWRAWGIMVGVWAVWVPAWIVGALGVVASFGSVGAAEEVVTEAKEAVKVPTPSKLPRSSGKKKNK